MQHILFNYHALVTGALIFLGWLGIWRLHDGAQWPELPVKTSATAGVSLSSFLFDQKHAAEHRPVIVLAASGGGTRAALYTASVLLGLSRLNVASDVVLGSGISGGGAAVAYFAAKRPSLSDPHEDQRAAAWKKYFDVMQQPFIQDVLERATEWRMLGPERLGFLLSESFQDRWELSLERQTLGGLGDFGLILNTSIAGHFDRSDAPVESRTGTLIHVERHNRKLTRTDLAGGRLIITNLKFGDHLTRRSMC